VEKSSMMRSFEPKLKLRRWTRSQSFVWRQKGGSLHLKWKSPWWRRIRRKKKTVLTNLMMTTPTSLLPRRLKMIRSQMKRVSRVSKFYQTSANARCVRSKKTALTAVVTSWSLMNRARLSLRMKWTRRSNLYTSNRFARAQTRIVCS